jgi:putative hydrolase of the HAD superfamily
MIAIRPAGDPRWRRRRRCRSRRLIGSVAAGRQGGRAKPQSARLVKILTVTLFRAPHSGSCQEAVLLDALGTLVALEPPAPRLRSELAERFGLILAPGEAEHAIAAEIAYYRGHLNEGRDRASVDDLRRRCTVVLRDALAAADVPLGPLTEALLASLEFTPFPDAAPALKALRDRGWRLVVASNWDWSLHEVLERVGLAPLLDGVVTSAEAGASKPAPAVFERALDLAGVSAARAIHVGDSLLEDIEGARTAGVTPVLIHRDGRNVEAGVRTISSLRELIA